MIDLLKQAVQIKNDGLFLCVLGSSGAGKSHFIGTYPGRVLYLYGSGESHGPSSASKSNDNIIAVPWDKEVNTAGQLVDLHPNKIISRIKDLLSIDTLKQNEISCVALDSITNLVADMKNTELFKQRCTDGRGRHNPFKETEALVEIMSQFVRVLQTLSDTHNIDIITTLDLQIQSIADDGTILEAKPSLPTFGVAKSLVQMFPDILVLGRMGEKRLPMFQNLAKTAATSVDRNTQTVVKYVEFNPRLRGVAELPEMLEPNAAKLLEMKNGE